MIKLSKHSIKFANSGKLNLYLDFLDQYYIVVKYFVNHLFNNKVIYKNSKGENKIFCIKEDLLDCPMFFSISNYSNTFISARAIKCASNQALGIVRSSISERRKLLYVREKLQKENKRTRSITRKINKTLVIYPKLDNVSAELNSICCSLEQSNSKEFDFWITLHSFSTKRNEKIIIPIKSTRHSRKFDKFENKNSFMFKKNSIDIRYEIPDVKEVKDGKVLGADSGLNTCITLSDGQTTQKNIHGHDLKSICQKVSRKKKGSKAYKKAQAHRKNYINWSINQLNLTNVKQINLENVSNFRHKKRTSKFLNSWTNTAIREKLIDRCNLLGVQVKLQSAPYRSQRCSCCGYVCKKNRKGKDFSCKHCSFQADADLNASLNHEVNLPSINYLHLLDNKNGFFWKEEGLFDLKGQELIVPVTNKDIKI